MHFHRKLDNDNGMLYGLEKARIFRVLKMSFHLQLTTQSVYRVQLPNSRSGFTTGSQLNLPADLLLRGPSSPSGKQNFLVLGLFVAGFDRQAAEPAHRCAPPSSMVAFHPQALPWSYSYGLQSLPNQPHHQQTGPICQVCARACLGH